MKNISPRQFSGWGRYPRSTATAVLPESIDELAVSQAEKVLARGEGRSYGDAALCRDGLLVLTDGLRGVRHFDPETGILVAEAGLTFADMIETFLPQGWFPAITPGTKFVSMGGAVAADVHGKNHHHAGSFASQLIEFELMLADGSRRVCSPDLNSSLYWATLGGMGLTGIITEVKVQMRSVETSSIVARHYAAPDLDSTLRYLEESDMDDDYSVAWIDCLSRGSNLGRSILMLGHHATLSDIDRRAADPLAVSRKHVFSMPFDLPSMAMNSMVISAFNYVYYWTQGRKRHPFLSNLDAFFYPLDRVDNWNRLYGKRGFLQYQVVLPESTAAEGIRYLLERFSVSRFPSFLAVLKRFGPGNQGILSFPAAGYTLALDLPMHGPRLLQLLAELDRKVIEYGGRVYLAKDSCLAKQSMASMYPRLAEWKSIKEEVDPEGRFVSDLSARLGLGTKS